MQVRKTCVEPSLFPIRSTRNRARWDLYPERIVCRLNRAGREGHKVCRGASERIGQPHEGSTQMKPSTATGPPLTVSLPRVGHSFV